MTSNTLDTPKVSTGFDINAEFRSVLRELGPSPEDTGDPIGRPKWPGLCEVSVRESYLLTLPHNIGAK